MDSQGAEAIPINPTCGPGAYCARCGYDLRETASSGYCPECNTPCAESTWLWTDQGNRWRYRLRLSSFFFLAGLTLSILLYLSVQVVRRIPGGPSPLLLQWLSWVWSWVPMGLLLVAVALATSPCPQVPMRLERPRLRRFARIMAFAGLAGTVALPPLQWWLERLAYNYWLVERDGPLILLNALMALVPVLLCALALLTMWLAARYLVSVLKLLSAETILWHFRNAAYGLLACVTLGTVARLTLQISMGWFARSNVVVDPQSTLFSAFLLFNWFISAASFVLSAWLVVALWRMARRLGRAPGPSM